MSIPLHPRFDPSFPPFQPPSLRIKSSDNPLIQPRPNRTLRLMRPPSDVRREDETRVFGEDSRRRLRVEDIERQAAEVAGAERVERCLLIEYLAARGVDEKRAAPHGRDLRRADHAPRLAG